MYTKYVVVCTGRTGSNMLMSLISSRDDVRAYWEFFYDKYKEHLSEEEIKDGVAALEKVVYKNHPEEVKAAGFKFIYDHVNLPYTNGHGVLDYLRKNKDIKVIHLKRRNILRTYLSHEMAFKHNKWHAFKDEDRLKEDDKIEIDFEACLEYFLNISREEAHFDGFFSDNPKLDMYYECIVEDPQEETKRIQHFLGLKPKPLSSTFKRLNHKRLCDTITNYWQLKSMFKNSRFYYFFED